MTQVAIKILEAEYPETLVIGAIMDIFNDHLTSSLVMAQDTIDVRSLPNTKKANLTNGKSSKYRNRFWKIFE